ncbi:MAG TPA: hypothetical protein VL393_06165 [Candidatus Binataceae bacterium]|nr:hypothetical protein [Candidatus Binataceae bacterium]
MTKPSIGDLLSAVAAGLRESVLPEIPAGPTRRQIQVAISIIRRASLVWDKVGPYLYADNKDIEETLRRISPLLDRAESNESTADLKPLCQKLRATLDQSDEPGVEYPSPATLGARNVELQGSLAELQEALHAESCKPPEGSQRPPSAERVEILAMLRALFERMLERELEVTTPSAARK